MCSVIALLASLRAEATARLQASTTGSTHTSIMENRPGQGKWHGSPGGAGAQGSGLGRTIFWHTKLNHFGDRPSSGILLLSRAQSRAVRAQQHGAQQHSMSVAAADVFLSYSRTDTPAVRQIQAYLKQAA